MMPDNSSTKIMIVNWKWEHCQPINDTKYEQQPREVWQKQIEEEKSSIFQCHKALSDFSENAFVISCYVYQSANQLLVDIIEHICKKNGNADVFLFLHRGNNYTGEHLPDILEQTKGKVNQIFLFGEGTNHIYYNSQKRGFLDESSDFYEGRDESGKPITTYDQEQKQLNKPYFDNVWHYYEHDFNHKITELEQDLFDILALFTFPNRPQSYKSADFIEQFKEEEEKRSKKLYYRIKSLLGVYDDLTYDVEKENYMQYADLKRERQGIIELEKKRHTAYLLDDFVASVKHVIKNDVKDEEVSRLYAEHLKPALTKMFLEQSNEPITVAQIRQLQRDFAQFRQYFAPPKEQNVGM